MRSGELARTASVSTDTLRHYERLGCCPRPSELAEITAFTPRMRSNEFV
jgi:Predicted transcriptional regulators